ncbi:MAG: hypothetical protein MI974_12075 [Chitinophagales bacterium]|nr:hypothetical protein [Chitinophagales bacterium]
MIRVVPNNLSFSQSGSQVTLNTSYRLFFDPIDRHFAANGVNYYERIRVMGVDPGPDQVLYTRWFRIDDITPGDGTLVLEREREINISRTSLQEDPGLNNDEIRCEISIESPNFPTVVNPRGNAPDGTFYGNRPDGTTFYIRNTNQITLAN